VLTLSVKRSFQVNIIVERCKGCGICVSLCPVKVLDFSEHLNSRGYRFVEAKYPEKCIGCKKCELHCPDFAIYVNPSSEAKCILIKANFPRA